jgi:hypothetical protein
MKIAMLEMDAESKSATGERARALATFLRSHDHHVDIVAPSPERLRDFARFKFSLFSRLRRRALRLRSLPHLWDFIADELEPKVRAGHYDAVFARLQPVSYVLTRPLDCLKVFDMANIGFLENYYAWNGDASELEIDYLKEMDVYRAADYVFLHHEILADFFRRNVYDDDKVRAVRMGCYPTERTAEYSSSPRLVYAGSYQPIQDPYLLSLLAKKSPYPVDCYGPRDPNYSFLPARLNYKGFAKEPTFLADYQFGLITVSSDRLRQYSPSTKFAYYFSYGLPVLFPEWMLEGHTYEAAIPYTEGNFAETVRRLASDPNEWARLSRTAREIAESLSWDKVLAPVQDILSKAR